jgi:hypothetical protein
MDSRAIVGNETAFINVSGEHRRPGKAGKELVDLNDQIRVSPLRLLSLFRTITLNLRRRHPWF